ncbi:unnamed protein product [Lactuca saligna]|uniref:Transposase MuDR plant domain-containing protein n=1 Tax=Lactuca saligna TaxID=75948 RepID=A0AA35Z022_LACSI|nr:unnamed protein product [Lactuca saligna]
MEVINNEEFESLDEGSDQDRERRALIRNLGKEKRCNLGSVHIQSFSVGQKFKSKKELKELIDVHALETRRNLFFKKNDSQRLRAQCRGVVPVINKGQVGTKPTTSKSKGKEGLQIAVDQLFPNAEHRYCIRHIHDNMRKKWGQTEYRDHLWRCASATTIPEFEHLMKEFSEYDKEACQWLKQIPPVHWARSHFSGRAVSDVLISNMCEVFNGKIEKGRDKPVGRPKKKRRQSEGERLSKRQKASEGDGVNEMQGENSQGPRNDGVQKLSRKHLWFDDVVMYGAQTLVCLTW